MNEREALILGALLHDIGKFMQRAELPLSKQSKGMESSICKLYKGRYSHSHVLWTNEFFETNKNQFPINVFEQVSEEATDNCANLAAYHHNPDTTLHRVVQQADFFSSGERLQKDIEDESAGRDAHKKTRLHSIFEKVDLGSNPSEIDKYRYELHPMTPDKNHLFPKPITDLTPPEGELLVECYKRLWGEFNDKFSDLPKDDFQTFLNALVSLLETYTWCIPSSTMHQPDISLFDHSKTTAAIAVALYEYHKQTDTMTKASIEDRNAKKFILLGGDLSGIQRYLFSLSHSNVKGVSRILRARSFYLEALCNVAAHYLLHSLDLPLICNLMRAGGRFVLLLPNTEKIKSALDETSKSLCDWYRKSFAGELTLNLNWSTELCGEDFEPQSFSKVLSLISGQVETKKAQKLSEVLTDDAKWKEADFVIEDLYQYEKGACESCAKQPATEIFTEYGVERHLCTHCREQEKAGRWLTRKKFVGYSKQKPKTSNYISLYDGKYYVSFWDEDKLPDQKDFYLMEEMYEPHKRKSSLGIYMVANHVPIFETDEEYGRLCALCDLHEECEIERDRKKGAIKTFQCIASKAIKIENEKKMGMSMLGLLKADVDRLGFIFGIGLDQRLSVSRYATMSRMMNVFFSGYLETIMDDEYKNIYTVYSGGDDLFLISDWETTVDFSRQLYADFKDFTCNNPDINLSAAVATIKPRFPIRRGADMVGEYLDESKGGGRDRITVFNTTAEWKDLPELFDFAKVLDDEFRREDSKIRSTFLYRLLKYHQMYLESLDGKIGQLKFHSLMSYDIARNIEERKKIHQEEVIVNKALIDQLIQLYKIPPNSVLMKNLKIPLFWILYRHRGRR